MYSFENKFPLWHTHKGLVAKTNQIVFEDEVINVYPDNDGGLWFYHPRTRNRETVDE